MRADEAGEVLGRLPGQRVAVPPYAHRGSPEARQFSRWVPALPSRAVSVEMDETMATATRIHHGGWLLCAAPLQRGPELPPSRPPHHTASG